MCSKASQITFVEVIRWHVELICLTIPSYPMAIDTGHPGFDQGLLVMTKPIMT